LNKIFKTSFFESLIIIRIEPQVYIGSSDKRRMEKIVSKGILGSFKLEEMSEVLSAILGKLSEDKPVYLINPNKLLTATKGDYEKFIKEMLADKQKVGDFSAKERMVDLIQRVSSYYEQVKAERLTKSKKEKEELTKQVQELGKRLEELEVAQDKISGLNNNKIIIDGERNNDSNVNQMLINKDWAEDIPTFRAAENEILDEWIYVVEKIAANSNVKVDKLVSVIPLHLKDRALRCYRIWERENNDKSWDSLKDRFSSLFSSRDS